MNSLRRQITDKFNDRFNDIDEVLKINAMKMGFPLYRVPAASTSSTTFKQVMGSAQGAGAYTFTFSLNNSKLISVSPTSGTSLVPPYVYMVSFPNNSVSTGIYVGDVLSGINGNEAANPVVPTIFYGYNVIGLFRDGLYSSIGGVTTKLLAPNICSDYNYTVSKTVTYGIRETTWGDLEFYNPADGKWYYVNGKSLGKTARRIGIFSQYVPSLTVTPVTNTAYIE